MGRTVPSFRIVIAEEKKEWKPFRSTWIDQAGTGDPPPELPK